LKEPLSDMKLGLGKKPDTPSQSLKINNGEIGITHPVKP
jgi:hypothetical protein